MIDDAMRRVLYIDLRRRSYQIRERPELFEAGLGGSGAGIRLLEEECPKGIDAFADNAPIILTTGPLCGLFPVASKAVAMFKSPLTGNLGESHAGGRAAVALRLAGYGAVVIKGISESPVYVTIQGDGVRFRNASALWGVSSSHTVARIVRERESGAGLRAVMRIGKAGEKLVRYASVITETYRHFGRLGLGAVFGSKKLKALVISGNRILPVPSPRRYRQVYSHIYDAAVHQPTMRKYHDLGTAQNILPLNAIGGLPTMNLQQARFDAAGEISGESLAEHYLGRRLACAHCPVACVHLAALREPHEKEPYFYKTTMISYDYEPLYALGSMLGIADIPGLLKLIDVTEHLGLDAMSTGVVLAWATEAMERDVISETDAAGVGLQWGDGDSYMRAARLIVEQPNAFYVALARGVDYASARYGGSDYALAFGGNEMPGYHTGPAAHISYLTAARHSHLDSAGYSLDQEALAKGQRPTPEDIADSLLAEERWRQVLSSLVVCYFARGIYTPQVVTQCLEIAGIDLAEGDLARLGAEILARKNAFKVREGFNLETARLPRRIFETPSPSGPFDEKAVRQAVSRFARRVMTQD